MTDLADTMTTTNHTMLHSSGDPHCRYCGKPATEIAANPTEGCDGPVPIRKRMEIAERSLKSGGYTYVEGAEAWKPPLGAKTP